MSQQVGLDEQLLNVVDPHLGWQDDMSQPSSRWGWECGVESQHSNRTAFFSIISASNWLLRIWLM